MARCRAVQRRTQLTRVWDVLRQYVGWREAGLLPDGGEETIRQLRQLQEDIGREMLVEGQQPL